MTSTSIPPPASWSLAFESARATADAGEWIYLAGALQVDADGHAVRFSGLDIATDDEALAPLVQPIVAQLRDKMSVDYGVAYQNLLNAANQKLTRPLKDGLPDGRPSRLRQSSKPSICRPTASRSRFRATGELKILYGM